MNKHLEMAVLTRTVYIFGAVGRGPYGFMTFMPDGRIESYKHKNEAYFQIHDDRLLILDENKRVSSELTLSRCGSGRLFASDKCGHYLEPVFSLPPVKLCANRNPPLLVNTVPKSGTYLLAEALKLSGYKQVRLHLSSEFFHDNRNVSDDEIHWNPDDRTTAIPARAIASILRDGEFVVGHVDDQNQLREIQEMGCQLINVVRNPYDQILSMMKFRMKKVQPRPFDLVWQSIDGDARLKAFIISHPVDYWLNFSKMLADNFPVLRYEDLLLGEVKFSGLDISLEAVIASGLEKAIGMQTSTLLERTPSHWSEVFNDRAICDYLNSLGFADYSERLWPSSSS